MAEGFDWKQYARESEHARKAAEKDNDHAAEVPEEIRALEPIIPYQDQNESGTGQWTHRSRFVDALGSVARFLHIEFKDHKITRAMAGEMKQIQMPNGGILITIDQSDIGDGEARKRGLFQALVGEDDSPTPVMSSSFEIDVKPGGVKGSGVESMDNWFGRIEK